LAKSGLWISIGILVKTHFESFLSLIIGKPVPKNLIDKNNIEMVNNVTKWIGIFIIAIGVGVALSAFGALMMKCLMPSNNLNFKLL
jgi:hypothetical protein